MIKKEHHIWIYLVGVVLMFGILIIIAKNVVLPILNNRKNPESVLQNLGKPSTIIDSSKDYSVVLTTNLGDIKIQLYPANAPQNVNNFVYLAGKGYYNGTKFHRLIPDLLVQGGDRNTVSGDISSWGKGRPNYLINDEVNWDSLNLSQDKRNQLTTAGYTSDPNVSSIPLQRYSVAMASAGPNTNGSQFFIMLANVGDPRIDAMNGYFTVIGEVTQGTDTLDKINQVQVNDPNSQEPIPTTDIVIQNVKVNYP